MKALLTLLIALAVGGTILYFFLDQQKTVAVKAGNAQQSAQEKADAYKANQARMMKELGQ